MNSVHRDNSRVQVPSRSFDFDKSTKDKDSKKLASLNPDFPEVEAIQRFLDTPPENSTNPLPKKNDLLHESVGLNIKGKDFIGSASHNPDFPEVETIQRFLEAPPENSTSPFISEENTDDFGEEEDFGLGDTLQKKVQYSEEQELSSEEFQANVSKEQISLDKEQINLDKEQINLDKEQINLDKEQINLDKVQESFAKEKVGIGTITAKLDEVVKSIFQTSETVLKEIKASCKDNVALNEIFENNLRKALTSGRELSKELIDEVVDESLEEAAKLGLLLGPDGKPITPEQLNDLKGRLKSHLTEEFTKKGWIIDPSQPRKEKEEQKEQKEVGRQHFNILENIVTNSAISRQFIHPHVIHALIFNAKVINLMELIKLIILKYLQERKELAREEAIIELKKLIIKKIILSSELKLDNNRRDNRNMDVLIDDIAKFAFRRMVTKDSGLVLLKGPDQIPARSSKQR